MTRFWGALSGRLSGAMPRPSRDSRPADEARPPGRSFRLVCPPDAIPAVEALLAAQGFPFEPEPFSPWCRRLTGEPGPLGGSLAAFFGLIHIQDRSSMAQEAGQAGIGQAAPASGRGLKDADGQRVDDAAQALLAGGQSRPGFVQLVDVDEGFQKVFPAIAHDPRHAFQNGDQGPIKPDQKALRKLHALAGRIHALGEALLARFPEINGFVHSVRRAQAAVAVGERQVSSLGEIRLEEVVGDVRLLVSPDAFLQTNTAAAGLLYKAVAAAAGEAPDGTAWDLYCGCGGISLTLAPHFDLVHGVETDARAVHGTFQRPQLRRTGLSLQDLVQGRKGGGVVRLVGDFRDQFQIGHLPVRSEHENRPGQEAQLLDEQAIRRAEGGVPVIRQGDDVFDFRRLGPAFLGEGQIHVVPL